MESGAQAWMAHIHGMDEIAAIALPVEVRQENRVSHLSGILNRVQRHQCSEAYCLRTATR